MSTAALRFLLPLVSVLCGCRCARDADALPDEGIRSVQYEDSTLQEPGSRFLSLRRDGSFDLQCETNPARRSPGGCNENEVGLYRGRLPPEDNERLFRLLSDPPPSTLPVYDHRLSIADPGGGMRRFTITLGETGAERDFGTIAAPEPLERIAQELDRVMDVACQSPLAVLHFDLEDLRLEGRERVIVTVRATNPGTTPIRWEAPNEHVAHRAHVIVELNRDRMRWTDGLLEEIEYSPSCSKSGDVVEVPPGCFVRFRATAAVPPLPRGRTEVRLRFQPGARADLGLIYGVFSVRGQVIVP